MSWGGQRPGSGRKPKTAREVELGGNAGKRGRLLSHPSVPSEPIDTAPAVLEEFDAPNDLTTDERLVWLELAPLALVNRTLTRATALSFRILCRNVVLERSMAASVQDRGGPNHRGMIQRVDAELLRFSLSPCGKPMYEPSAAPEKPANPLDRYMARRRG